MKIQKIKEYLKDLGPGLITGAADNDPSGIATYSQAGAQFGLSQLWTCVYMLPLQLALQEACARIGATTGKGLAALIKENYGQALLYSLVFIVLLTNIINIGADIGAMAETVRLLLPINFVVLAVLFTLIITLLEIFIPYKTYSKILKWLCISLLIYPLTVFIVDSNSLALIKATFVPHLEFNFEFLFIITGLLGTTISPYLFFWEASQIIEENKKKGVHKGKKVKPNINKTHIWKIRFDNFIGVFFSELCAWAIIVVTALVLHAHGVTNIKTAADAAKALEPFVKGFSNAGYAAKLIFATGIIGLGLLAIPVLAGSSAYAISESLSWKKGLNKKINKAPGFYSIIIIATAFGLLLNFIGIDPMKALIYAAVLNGVVAVPLIAIIALLAVNKKIMGKHKSGFLSSAFIWLSFICMLIAAITLFISLAFNH